MLKKRKRLAYGCLLSYTALLLISLWGIVWGIGVSNSSVPTTYSTIVQTDAGIRLQQMTVIELAPVWFGVLYFYIIRLDRKNEWMWRIMFVRLCFGALLFWGTLGVNGIGPGWEVLHEVLTWIVYAGYIGAVACSCVLHVWDTVQLLRAPPLGSKKIDQPTFRNMFHRYPGRVVLIALEFLFLVATVVLGSIAFKVCGATTTCRQGFEFASITTASSLTAFFVLELQVAEDR